MTDDELDLPDAVDVLVVGGGAAGLSAATWLGRYRRRTLVVDAGEHRNRFVEQVNGLLGADPVTPAALYDRARADLSRYPHVTRVEGWVRGIDRRTDGRFRAEVGEQVVLASRVVLATGVRDVFPAVAGFETHYGADVYHCPSCEGFDARDRDVAVLGWGAHVPGFAAELLDWASSVVVVTDGPPPEITQDQCDWLEGHGIELIDDDPAQELLGARGELCGLRLASGRVLPITMAFFSIGHEPTLALADDLGCARTDEGVLAVTADAETTVPGVFAAGDITPGMQLVPVAIGKGATAGVAAAKSLHGTPTVREAPDAAPATDTPAPDGAVAATSPSATAAAPDAATPER